MPTLNWIGKEAVVNHHRQVPFRLLRDVPSLSCGDPGSGNLIVQGDNLLALKALLPYYAGQVKCIYIDPPYNTGNEGWKYNDNVNSPLIKKWLGETVGKDGETLDRHDRWLCMMYPRLQLLKMFLHKEGAMYVSIDDNEVHALRYALDEIFGPQNFISSFTWRKVDSPNDNKVALTPDHEHILAYARNHEHLKLAQMDAPDIVEAYGQVDESGRSYRDRLLKKNGKNSLRRDRPTMYFALTSPDGNPVYPLHETGEEARWAMGKEGVARHQADGTLVWKKRQRGGAAVWEPYTREFAPANPTRPYPSIWSDLPTMRQAKAMLRDLFSTADLFDTPKPIELIERLLKMTAGKDALVLDSFSGSGTTGHSVLRLNHTDGGSRRFILVEMDEKIARDITAERVRRVANGYKNPKGDKVDGLGGDFRYCELGNPIFNESGKINPTVTFADLARHVYFTETGEPLPKERIPKTPFLGDCRGVGVYLLYNGILGDKSAAGGNVLTRQVLNTLPPFKGQKVIYCAGNLLGKERLETERIIVRQTPYEIRVA
jgi:DNA modification methylase